MSKIKHWDESTQQWVIDGASNAANIELTNPGYLDENGESISVDQGFTKLDNRIKKAELNLAWIYQHGAKGGGGGGGGGGGVIDSTSYNIEIEEGNRVYTSGNSITIHLTITGGSVKKNFNVIIQDDKGNTKGNYVVIGLTKTEITISGLTDSINRLTINANSGQNYAIPVSITVVAGAIKLIQSNIPNSTIYPQSPVGQVTLNAQNSTDSDLLIVINKNGEQMDSFEIKQAKESQFRIDSIVQFLEQAKTTEIGETFTFEIYAQGVLNDNILKSNSITFSCTIVQPNTLYILTYDVNKSVPENNVDLDQLNKYVYGNSIQFNYQLTYSRVQFSYYNINYEVTPCYFEEGQLISDESRKIEGTISRVIKDVRQQFLFNTASLPDDTIYNPETNQYKFVKVSLNAVSIDSDTITDTKVLYFVLSEATTKYITATNFNNSLIGYFSPVMGVPTGNITTWTYDNKNTRFPYSSQGAVSERYVSLVGNNLNGFMSQTDMQGMHLLGKSWVDLDLNLFSGNANEVNLLNGTGWSLSFTFRTDSNVDDSDVVVSLGKYNTSNTLLAGIEIRANKVIYAVQTQQYTLNITKGDLTTVDIVAQKYVGPGDTETRPTHWFIKTYLNGVLSLVTSHSQSEVFNTDNSGLYGWYFDESLHLGGRVVAGEITDAASVHIYDFKIYSSALSDNEIIQNYISSYIYSELGPNANPDMSTQNDMLQKNFIQIGVDGNYHNILFDESDETQYKDATSLLNSLISALAESRIPYPIVVINQTSSDSNFLGITESKFNEDLKETVMGSRFPITMDYYTMGNQTPIRIENPVGTGMSIGIQGTSSLRYNSKNYEIYMGEDDEGKSVLVQMREDWLPENRYTLKADVMDSSHVNNVLIGKIINGLVTTTDSGGNEVTIKPLDNTPPMSKSGYQYAGKVKHTSEGYPCILFIKFKATGSSIANTRCMGIYNFNLGRYAYYNLGMKLLTSIQYATNDETYPRMVGSYTESLEVETGAPVYSMEVQENSNIAMFDQADPDILGEGVFEFPYDSDGQGMTNLQKLLTFLASFGYNIETDRKKYIDNDWKTPILKKIDGVWKESGRYYDSFDPVNYVKSTLDLHMNWNNMVSYYMIAIIFGLVDSMAKNLTLRSWGKSNIGDNIWYMCFYDMDTALRVNNVGAETVPYNAHLHRYYTTEESGVSEARVTNHCSSISGVFNQEYSGYNTRLQEIVENINVSYDSSNAKTLQSVYKELRTNLFPDPAEFIDKYYGGQINQVGSALYNYDYYLKYLQVEKTYNPATGTYGSNTYSYSEISYLHGNGSTNVKDWFVKRIHFLDGIYGVTSKGINDITGITNTPLAQAWLDNNATFIPNLSTESITLGLQAESQIRVTVATASEPQTFWVNEQVRDYKVRNVGSRQVVTIYGNQYLTALDKFNNFTWDTIGSLNFPIIKSLSLRNQTNIRVDGFLVNTSNLQSLVSLDLHGVTLLNSDSTIAYIQLKIAQQLPNLEELDISNSSFNDVPLSSSSILRSLNLSGTSIKTLTYSNQPMLEELIIDECFQLESIDLRDCPKLKSITIPSSVRTIFLGNCTSLETLEAPYTGSQRVLSNLVSVTVSACPNLKVVNLQGQNHPNLNVSLVGAPAIEELNLNTIATRDLTFPAKKDWTSLKKLDLGNSSIEYLNYYGTTPLVVDYLDLDQFENLQSLYLRDNISVKGVKCANIQSNKITLNAVALANCSSLAFLYGNFKLAGTRIFNNCNSLQLNSDAIYNTYGLLQYPVPFANDERACNITLDPSLNSMEEMFSGCLALSGSDFNMMMLLLNDNITNLSKMFLNCVGINAEIKYDLFRHCPNVTNITSFAEGTEIQGGIYSRSETSEGTFDFLPKLESASAAFNSTNISFIDTDVFAPKNGQYIQLRDVDYIFANCVNLYTYQKATREQLIPNGALNSKTFFSNLRSLGTFPEGMFIGCKHVDMNIISENVNGVMFDYLFHFPYQINARNLNSLIYSGINLKGTIHNNIFGGKLKTDGENYIVDFTIINSPFEASGDDLYCNLSEMGDMFELLRDKLVQAKYVLKGLKFTNSSIPSNIFEGCSKLINISGFFSNEQLTNNGEIYEFPQAQLFQDCTALQDVSYLFDGAYNLNIKLLGEGFKNTQLTSVDGIFNNSGVFGMIPYRLFYMEKNGQVQHTINSMIAPFQGCFKLGYTSDRALTTDGTYYDGRQDVPITWSDCIIKVPGTRVPFQLDFTYFDGTDPWYIDGRDWADLGFENAVAYNNQIFEWDRLQKQALSDDRDREVGYQNYMFPADLVRYCSPECTMLRTFRDLTYTQYYLSEDNEGIVQKRSGDKGGLVGRLPCKLFEDQTQTTVLERTFENLYFSAFINFNSYKLNTLEAPASECRGIKFPPDLFVHNTELVNISRIFSRIFVEVGVDINTDLFANNNKLTNISYLFQDIQLNDKEYKGSENGEYAQIYSGIFDNLSELQDVSNLFAISSLDAGERGLLHVSSTLFGSTSGVANNPRITNVSGMFLNNVSLKGTIPLFDEGVYTRIRSNAGYVEGVMKDNISNAETFINIHDTSWIPQTWIEE